MFDVDRVIYEKYTFLCEYEFSCLDTVHDSMKALTAVYQSEKDGERKRKEREKREREIERARERERQTVKKRERCVFP